MAHYLGALGDAATGLADIAGWGTAALTTAAAASLYSYYQRTGYHPRTASGQQLKRQVYEKMVLGKRKYPGASGRLISRPSYRMPYGWRSRGAMALRARLGSGRKARAIKRFSRPIRGRRATRGVRKRAQLMNPLKPPPRNIIQKHIVKININDEDTVDNINTSLRSGFKKNMEVNDFNTPWKGIAVNGQQPWGHDEYALLYSKAQVLAVHTQITLIKKKTADDSVNGTMYMKLSDSATELNWANHGSAITNLAGSTVTGEGFRQYIKSNPRYKTRELTANNTSGGPNKISLGMLWKPRYTHLDYDRNDFTQTLGAINTGVPPKIASLHWGFINYVNGASADAFDIHMTKTYYVKYGNPKPLNVS